MASRALALNSVLILRILTLLFCAASIVLIVTNTFKLQSEKTNFTEVIAFRYLLASGAVGFLYSLIQIPFAFYHAYTQKRWIRDGYLPDFDFYGDKIVSLILASGVGVGFGASLEVKRGIDDLFYLIQLLEIQLQGALDFDVDEGRSKTKKFLDRGILSSALLLGALTCMLALTLLTSMARRK